MSDPALALTAALPAGQRIGSYAIEHAIGAGTSGTVYAARSRENERVALKVIHRELLADRQIFGRFRREAAILKRLEGHHVARLLDFVEDDGLLAIALEYVDGASLEALLAQKAPIAMKDAVEITLQVCAALGAAHAAGVIHRDLKPANVLVEAEEGPPSSSGARRIHVRVVDFGLAKVVHGEHMITGLTEQDMIFGTPEYMAPEQARGDEVDARCDLYAAGVMLYEMTVGSVPFRGRTPIATMTAHLTQEPPPPRVAAPAREISPALDAVIRRALAKEREERYSSARAFAEALAAARDQPQVIVPREVVDPLALAIGDTDLNISITALAHRATVPSTRGVVSATRGDTSPTLSPIESRRWLWLVVAVIAAAIGVAIGAIVGAR